MQSRLSRKDYREPRKLDVEEPFDEFFSLTDLSVQPLLQSFNMIIGLLIAFSFFFMSLPSCQSTNNRTNSTDAGTYRNPILDAAGADP